MGRHKAPEPPEEIPELPVWALFLGYGGIVFFGTLGFIVIILYLLTL